MIKVYKEKFIEYEKQGKAKRKGNTERKRVLERLMETKSER
jgi:hypothetical protein